MAKEVDIDIEHAEKYMQHITATIRDITTSVDNMKAHINKLKIEWPDSSGEQYRHLLIKDIKEYENFIAELRKVFTYTENHTNKAKDILNNKY